MLSEENKKNLDSFKTAMRQEVRNAGYFLEDAPDLIREKRLEREYEKQLEAKRELEALQQEAEQCRKRLDSSGYQDVEEACRQAKAQQEAAQAAYAALFDQYAGKVDQLGKYQRIDKRMTLLIRLSLLCIAAAWFFSFQPLLWIGLVLFAAVLLCSRGVIRAKKLAGEQMPPDLIAAEEKKRDAEQSFQQISRVCQDKRRYEELQEKIRSLQKKRKEVD